MKIKDLIAELQKAPQENEICFYIPEIDDTLTLIIENIVVYGDKIDSTLESDVTTLIINPEK